MYFLVDNKKKICLGWSAKCGCTHIKTIFKYIQYGTICKNNAHQNTFGNLPINYNSYTNIIFIRNPYKRLVSGFLNKFIISKKPAKRNIEKWIANKLNVPITFKNLVSSLGDWGVIHEHHFCPQLSEAWKDDLKISYIFDIENINYSFIEEIFDKKIDKSLVVNNHKNVLIDSTISSQEKIYDYPIQNIPKCNYHQFYNDKIKQEVYNFYIKDFTFFEQNNFKYDI